MPCTAAHDVKKKEPTLVAPTSKKMAADQVLLTDACTDAAVSALHHMFREAERLTAGSDQEGFVLRRFQESLTSTPQWKSRDVKRAVHDRDRRAVCRALGGGVAEAEQLIQRCCVTAARALYNRPDLFLDGDNALVARREAAVEAIVKRALALEVAKAMRSQTGGGDSKGGADEDDDDDDEEDDDDDEEDDDDDDEEDDDDDEEDDDDDDDEEEDDDDDEEEEEEAPVGGDIISAEEAVVQTEGNVDANYGGEGEALPLGFDSILQGSATSKEVGLFEGDAQRPRKDTADASPCKDVEEDNVAVLLRDVIDRDASLTTVEAAEEEEGGEVLEEEEELPPLPPPLPLKVSKPAKVAKGGGGQHPGLLLLKHPRLLFGSSRSVPRPSARTTKKSEQAQAEARSSEKNSPRRSGNGTQKHSSCDEP